MGHRGNPLQRKRGQQLLPEGRFLEGEREGGREGADI